MVQTMADSKATGFSKVVQKHSLRAKERFMQNFGKKDRTTDELFEIYQNNFNKQQTSAARLQKELKNYATCAREMQAASKSLMECIADIYEHDWPGHDEIPGKVQTLELLWGDLCHRINDQCTIPLSTYLSQFSEMRNKMDKRGRKLLDYDGSRHNLETVQTASKKRDDIKVAKAREQMEEARRLYEVLNKELHEELPSLYDSRIPFFVNTFQTLFSAEANFHQEHSKVYSQLAELIELLATEAVKGTYQTDANRYLSQSPYAKAKLVNSQSPAHSPTSLTNTSDTQIAKHNYDESEVIKSSEDFSSESALQRIPNSNGSNDIATTDANDTTGVNHKNTSEKKSEELYEIPVGATTKDLPAGVLYKVKATYKYTAEDTDELSFESNEILHVVQYDDPEEQEEGWLMGIRELSGEKGLFPANFTRPI